MRKIMTSMAALALAAVVAVPALAQDKPRFGFGGFGGGSLGLLGNKSVQDELKLADDQVKKVTDLQEKQRGAIDFQNTPREEIGKKMQELNEQNEKALAEILKPDQSKRLKQISLQQRGGNALADPAVAKDLGLNDEQKEKVAAIQKDGQAAMRELFQPGGDREEAMKKMQEFRKSQNEKLLGLLTADQKTKWKDMVGAEFKGEIKPAFGGFGRKPGKPPVN